MSFMRQGCLLMRYSLSPLRKRRRVNATSSYSRSGNIFVELSKVSVTSQKDWLFRCCVPPKMTSCMLEPRMVLADCSPNTQRMASATLLLPQPFGPTMQVTPLSNFISVLSAKDLKPLSSTFLKFKVLILPCDL